jgi:hypothetical protein
MAACAAMREASRLLAFAMLARFEGKLGSK